MTISGIINNLIALLNQLIQVLMILGTVAFLWGVIQYVLAGESADKMKKARDFLIWGIIGLFFMVAMWGIVYAIQNTIFGRGAAGNSSSYSSGSDYYDGWWSNTRDNACDEDPYLPQCD